MKRISREIKRSPRPKERRTSKGPKRQSEVTPITEDEHETERIYEIERKRKDSKDEASKVYYSNYVCHFYNHVPVYPY